MLDTLVSLLSHADSYSAEYAAVLRLARAHGAIAAGAEDVAIGILYYVLDPMICMGVEEVAHIDPFLHHPALSKQLEPPSIQLLQRFITAHTADITHMIAFITEIGELHPGIARESDTKALIGATLLRHCDGIGADLAKIIVDDVYAKNSWLWGIATSI